MRLAQSTAATRPISDAPSIGVVVLHVVADRAVMHDVVQRDHAACWSARKASALLVSGPCRGRSA